MAHSLSYLMGAGEISDGDLEKIGAEIKEKRSSGSRKLVIPNESLPRYVEAIKEKLTPGFWNEIVGEKIHFIFKFADGSTREFDLSPNNEKEIDNLCAVFNNKTPNPVPNVYKYLLDNSFYHDLILEYYPDLINRK